MMQERKANKGQKTELSADALYDKMIQRMDQQISYQKRVKAVLNEEQYTDWHKIQMHMLREQNHQKPASKKAEHQGKKGHS